MDDAVDGPESSGPEQVLGDWQDGALTWAAPDPPLVSTSAVEDALAAALAEGEVVGCVVHVVFVDDATLARLHGTYLGDPSETDVMTFDLRDPSGPESASASSEDGAGDDPGVSDLGSGAEPDRGPDAELYVSVDMAQRVAAERGAALDRELILYVVHGCLHLCGHDDHDDEDRAAMRAAEKRVMQRLGYSADDAPHDR